MNTFGEAQSHRDEFHGLAIDYSDAMSHVRSGRRIRNGVICALVATAATIDTGFDLLAHAPAVVDVITDVGLDAFIYGAGRLTVKLPNWFVGFAEGQASRSAQEALDLSSTIGIEPPSWATGETVPLQPEHTTA